VFTPIDGSNRAWVWIFLPNTSHYLQKVNNEML